MNKLTIDRDVDGKSWVLSDGMWRIRIKYLSYLTQAIESYYLYGKIGLGSRQYEDITEEEQTDV
jgi:hypothetical protein